MYGSIYVHKDINVAEWVATCHSGSSKRASKAACLYPADVMVGDFEINEVCYAHLDLVIICNLT